MCLSDTAFTNLKCGDSQGACIIFLRKNEKLPQISWKLKKLKGVVKSIAETLVLEEALESCFMINY